jgi:methionyl-tRNA synthetase
MDSYITTAINYVNGNPHFGHAYEVICADVLARYNCLLGKNVFFSTGTDEHGQKIADTAKIQGLSPIELCDKVSKQFKNLTKNLNISYDRFIRTTEQDHIQTVLKVWNKCSENGDIYLGNYTGWYNLREEQYVTETEAAKTNFCDPDSGKPLIKYSSPSYFFRLAKYLPQIKAWILENPNFIFPAERRNEILSKLEEEHTDLSISRLSTPENPFWGIPVNDSHSIFVWFDALINYLTVLEYSEDSWDKRHLWESATHIIGKDIIWFHAVIWPAMLLSLGELIPQRIIAHGHVLVEGRKMSKSLGNVIDPQDLLEKYPTDLVRLYVLSLSPVGQDFSVSEQDLISFNDFILVSSFGNLVSRVMSLTKKLCSGIIPESEALVLFDAKELSETIATLFSEFKFNEIITLLFNNLTIINKYLSESEPWKLGNSDQTSIDIIIKTALEGLYIISYYLQPFIPKTTGEIFSYLNIDASVGINNWDNFVPGTKIGNYQHLFKPIANFRLEKNMAKRNNKKQKNNKP